MKVGSLVEAQHDFSGLRETWGFDYPHKGDILTISHIEPHPKYPKLRMLSFEENSLNLCDRTVQGSWNFKEVQEPTEVNLDQILNSDTVN